MGRKYLQITFLTKAMYSECIFKISKLLEENIGKTLFDINRSKIFFDPPPRVMKIKTKINKWDQLNLKAFAQQRKP